MDRKIGRNEFPNVGGPLGEVLSYTVPNSGQNQKKRVSIIGDTFSHVQVLERILENWHGEPEQLFCIESWISWIRKMEPERHRSEASLAIFAKAVMVLLFNDENVKYASQLANKFGPKQSSKFQHLLSLYKEEDMDLVNLPRQKSESMIRTEREVLRTVVPDDDDGDFKLQIKETRQHNSQADYNVHKSLGEDEDGMMEFSSFFGLPRPEDKVPHRKRTQSGKQETSKKSKNEKSRNAKPSNFRRLPIKKKALSPDEIRRVCEDLSLTEDEEEEEEDGAPLSLMDKAMLKDNQGGYGDLYLENDTPPASPQCTSLQRPRRYWAQNRGNSEQRRKQSLDSNIKPSRCYGSSASPSYSSNSYRSSNGPRLFPSPYLSQADSILSKRKDKQPQAAGWESGLLNQLKGQNIDDIHLELPDLEEAPTDQDKENENFPVTEEEIVAKYPKPPSAPPMTLEMFEEIKKALDLPPKEKVVSGFGFRVLQEDLAIINDVTEWLIDLNIDFYLELIRERSKQPGYPRVYVFHSFFYTLLSTQDEGYKAVEETTGDNDIFKFDLVFFPINLNHHWRLVVFDFKRKRLVCYDSMRHDNTEIKREIANYVALEYRRKYFPKNRDGDLGEANLKQVLHHTNGESQVPSQDEEGKPDEAIITPHPSVPDDEKVKEEINNNCVNDESKPENVPVSPEEKIRLEHNRLLALVFDDDWDVQDMENIPRQRNAIDCGIFVLQYAEYLSRGESFDFDQTNIPYFRKRMMYETITKTLLTTIT